ncbi:MAG: hypothetical protein V1733_02115 [bacterium]
MTIKEIEDLLIRFEEGKTTLQEEHLLREFFLKSDVPSHLQEYQLFFRFTALESCEETSPGFEMKLKEKLEQGLVIRRISYRKRMVYSFSIATSIVLLAGLVFTFRTSIFPVSQPYGTITDPQLAYIETRNALLLVSKNLNFGLDQMQQLQYFEKGIQQAQILSQYDKYQPIIMNPDDQNN